MKVIVPLSMGILILGAQSVLAEPFHRHHVLKPVDEAYLSQDFTAFRNQLLRIVEQKNANALAALLEPDLKCSFGADNGKAGCLKMWGLDKQPQKAAIWRDLKDVLLLGGQFERQENAAQKPNFNVFVAPYTHATAFISRGEISQKSMGYGFITGHRVMARQAPNLQAKVVETLSYNVVEIVDELHPQTGPYPWCKIITPHGKTAYVYGQFVRSTFAHRAIFQRDKEGWHISVLIAGD